MYEVQVLDPVNELVELPDSESGFFWRSDSFQQSDILRSSDVMVNIRPCQDRYDGSIPFYCSRLCESLSVLAEDE